MIKLESDITEENQKLYLNGALLSDDNQTAEKCKLVDDSNIGCNYVVPKVSIDSQIDS